MIKKHKHGKRFIALLLTLSMLLSLLPAAAFATGEAGAPEAGQEETAIETSSVSFSLWDNQNKVTDASLIDNDVIMGLYGNAMLEKMAENDYQVTLKLRLPNPGWMQSVYFGILTPEAYATSEIEGKYKLGTKGWLGKFDYQQNATEHGAEATNNALWLDQTVKTEEPSGYTTIKFRVKDPSKDLGFTYCTMQAGPGFTEVPGQCLDFYEQSKTTIDLAQVKQAETMAFTASNPKVKAMLNGSAVKWTVEGNNATAVVPLKESVTEAPQCEAGDSYDQAKHALTLHFDLSDYEDIVFGKTITIGKNVSSIVPVTNGLQQVELTAGGTAKTEGIELVTDNTVVPSDASLVAKAIEDDTGDYEDAYTFITNNLGLNLKHWYMANCEIQYADGTIDTRTKQKVKLMFKLGQDWIPENTKLLMYDKESKQWSPAVEGAIEEHQGAKYYVIETNRLCNYALYEVYPKNPADSNKILNGKTYTVPVSVFHWTEDRMSMADRCLADKATLVVDEQGGKTLYIDFAKVNNDGVESYMTRMWRFDEGYTTETGEPLGTMTEVIPIEYFKSGNEFITDEYNANTLNFYPKTGYVKLVSDEAQWPAHFKVPAMDAIGGGNMEQDAKLTIYWDEAQEVGEGNPGITIPQSPIKEALKQQIAIAEKANQTTHQFNDEQWATLQAALSSAKTLIKAPAVKDDELHNAYITLKDAINKESTADKNAAAKVDVQLLALPTIGSSNYKDEATVAAVQAARKAYNALTEPQKSLVKYDSKLTQAEVNIQKYTDRFDTAHAITVVDGTAGVAEAKYKTVVSITAGPAPAGMEFKEWTANQRLTFADKTNPNTTFTMTYKPVTITATYKEAAPEPPTPSTYTVAVEGGSSESTEYEAGDTVTITAAVAEDQVFKSWTSEDDIQFKDVSASTTTFTMPSYPVTVTANTIAKQGEVPVSMVHAYKDQLSMCDPLFDQNASYSVNGDQVTIKIKVAHPVPGFPELGENGTVLNPSVTYGGNTYNMSSDISGSASMTAKKTVKLFALEQGQSYRAQELSFTLPKAALFEQYLTVNAYVNVVMNSSETFRLAIDPQGNLPDGEEPEVKPGVNPNPDGSTTEKQELEDGTIIETTKKPDGSTNEITTKPDGTTIDKTTDKAGNINEKTTNVDGSTKTDIIMKDGSTSTTTSTAEGKTETTVQLPKNVTEAANKNNEEVVLPMPKVEISDNKKQAPTVNIKLDSKEQTRVVIPAEKIPAGAVAFIVAEDGSKQVIRKSGQTNEGIRIPVQGNVTVMISDNAKDFKDTKGHWGEDAAAFASSHEMFNGTSKDTFAPDSDMTRGMVATVLHNLENNPKADVNNSFGDVKNDAWYADGIAWAADQGIVSGVGHDNFAPNDSVTREQLAVMLYRYAGSPKVADQQLDYNDSDKISSYAKDAMIWATEQGIISGMGDGSANPQGTATRAQVASMLMRFVNGMN